MLDFCPYEMDETGNREFRRIDMDNLAYELIFRRGHNYEELSNTVLAGEKIIRKGKDKRLYDTYNDNSNHYMLWESLKKGEANGLELLKELIDKENKRLAEQKNDIEHEDYEGDESSYHENMMLRCDLRENDGVYVISYAEEAGTRRTAIMDAVPCCPNCHQRLPAGWKMAEDFCGIALLAPTGGGKTTFMVSMMINNWECLRYLGKDWNINAAHDGDYLYNELMKEAEKLYEDKECPPNTNVEYLIAPVFLNMDYKGKTLIVGIYDNSGEILKGMEPRDEKILLLTNMFAYIYLVEPKQMNVNLRNKDDDMKQMEKYCNLMSIEEQAEFQKKHRGETISAEKLLDLGNKKNGVRENPFKMYSDFKDVMQKKHMLPKLKHQHMCCTIIKCDLLNGLEEFEGMKQEKILFRQEYEEELFDKDLQCIRESLVEEIFDKFVFTKKNVKKNLTDTLASVSWHCISALGCDTRKSIEDREVEEVLEGQKVTHMKPREIYYLDGEYSPIRLAEPLVTCIQKKIEELGWCDETD